MLSSHAPAYLTKPQERWMMKMKMMVAMMMTMIRGSVNVNKQRQTGPTLGGRAGARVRSGNAIQGGTAARGA